MYTEKKRERRIRDKQRMKAKARKIGRNSWAYSNPDRAVKHADYLAVCSCDMCRPGMPIWVKRRDEKDKESLQFADPTRDVE